MSDRIYGLYKRIMKRDPNAINEIETLEEAKEIIKMLTVSTQEIKPNNAIYPMVSNQVIPSIQIGDKIFCEGQRNCLKLEEELSSKGFKTKTNCNEYGMWNVIIETIPCNENSNKYIDDVMRAVRQNMVLEENDESADNEIMQMDKYEVFKAYCHWNGLLGNWYNTLLKTIENIFSVELE